MNYDLESRRRRYFEMSTRLAMLESDELRGTEEPGRSTPGWGRNHVMEVGGDRVFVKRVPITESEREDLLSTRNRYELPTFYNYGVGSVGLGVGRELVSHIKTTNWVLNGELEGFPLMYHYRVVPISGERVAPDAERHRGYVEYWAGDENIDRYVRERSEATHELVLVLEYFPFVLENWLTQNPGHLRSVLEDLYRTIEFLRSRGVIHFDLHFQNVMTDGERTYLTDFGLVLDSAFALSEEERAFFDRNTLYDYGRCVSCLDFAVQGWYRGLSESGREEVCRRFGLPFGAGPWWEARSLMPHIEELGLNAEDVAEVVRLREAYALVIDFYATMQKNPRKDTEFPAAELARILKRD